MAGFTVKILKQGHIDELAGRFPAFRDLRGKAIPHTEPHRWSIGGRTVYCLQVIFLGKTGYGKSTTINKLIGGDLFPTDDISSCTKECYAAEYQLNWSEKPYYLSIGDLPGVGESLEADQQYLESYHNFLSKASVVVYMLRADQRDFAIDLDVFGDLFDDWQQKNKVLIGLNFTDQLQPNHLPAKIAHISSVFRIGIDRIVPFSAAKNEGLNNLASQIRLNLCK